jgi:hypothetical protein
MSDEMKMSDEMMKTVAEAAKLVDMSEEDVTAKVASIVKENKIDMEKEALLAKGLLHQWVASVKAAQKDSASDSGNKGGFWKQASGFFISMNEARDVAAQNRNTLVSEYNRNPNATYEAGKVALAKPAGDGYEIRRMVKGEEEKKEVPNLHPNHVEVDNNKFIIPIDNVEMYGPRPNPNFGLPQVKEEWRRNGTFVGNVNGVMGKYDFNYKGPSAKIFDVPCFEFVHFTCILNSSDDRRIHGATDKTLLSLKMNMDLSENDDEWVDTASVSIPDVIMEHAADNYSPLVDLERYHSILLEKPYKDRFVYTTGTVTNVNMTPTGNGNRILNITDLSMDFAFDESGSFGTTCWVPESIGIDFGIGSNVIIVGRTSQGTDKETGELRPISINVSGLYCVEKRGGDDTFEVKEDNLGWF